MKLRCAALLWVLVAPAAHAAIRVRTPRAGLVQSRIHTQGELEVAAHSQDSEDEVPADLQEVLDFQDQQLHYAVSQMNDSFENLSNEVREVREALKTWQRSAKQMNASAQAMNGTMAKQATSLAILLRDRPLKDVALATAINASASEAKRAERLVLKYNEESRNLTGIHNIMQQNMTAMKSTLQLAADVEWKMKDDLAATLINRHLHSVTDKLLGAISDEFGEQADQAIENLTSSQAVTGSSV